MRGAVFGFTVPIPYNFSFFFLFVVDVSMFQKYGAFVNFNFLSKTFVTLPFTIGN